MDDERFDSLARSMGRGVSRRTMLKALLGIPAAAAATTVLKREASAAGYGERCGGIYPPGPIIECDGYSCCAIGSSYGMCLSVEECNEPSSIACSGDANCPGNFRCCSDGYCSSDYWGECPDPEPPGDDDDDEVPVTTQPPPDPTTTTSEPVTTTPEPVTTTPEPVTTTPQPEPEPTTTTPEPEITTTTPDPGDPATTTTPGPGESTTTTPAPSGTTTTSAPGGGGNTGAGENVVVEPANVPGAFIRFDSVTSAGSTTITPVGVPGTLPDGSVYAVANGVWYEISTTAVFSGEVMICLPSGTFSDRLLHFVGGAWVDITYPGEPSGGTVCGGAMSLSPFAVVPLLGGDWGDDDDDDAPPAHGSGTGGGGDYDSHPASANRGHSSQGGGSGSGGTAALPSTGTGHGDSGNSGLLGLTLAASAAAAAAARVLRAMNSDSIEQ